MIFIKVDINTLKTKQWWDYLGGDLQELLLTSFLLKEKVKDWKQEVNDYSFVVFPISKAYEGFLKKLFLDMKFINEKDYFGKRFRIGKALNPSLNREKYKGESVYDKIVGHCGGEDLAKTLWNTWKTCRNRLFHWFPNEKQAITLKQAEEKVEMVVNSIDATFKECKTTKE